MASVHAGQACLRRGESVSLPAIAAFGAVAVQHILIIGATSAIAQATARTFAQRGSQLYLIARNQERLSSLAEDLKIRGAASVKYGRLDIQDFESHEAALNAAFAALGTIDVALIAHGTLPDQHACEADFTTTLAALNTNAIGTASLLTHLANRLERQQSGTIAVMTSVAGERGRRSNYVYGAHAVGSLAGTQKPAPPVGCPGARHQTRFGRYADDRRVQERAAVGKARNSRRGNCQGAWQEKTPCLPAVVLEIHHAHHQRHPGEPFQTTGALR